MPILNFFLLIPGIGVPRTGWIGPKISLPFKRIVVDAILVVFFLLFVTYTVLLWVVIPCCQKLRIHMTLMRIQIQLFTLMQIAYHFTEDPDQDPALLRSDGNLRPLVCRPSRAPFSASRPLLWASTALLGPNVSLYKLLNFDFNANPDPDPAFHCNANPDLASKKQKWCGSGSATLLTVSSLSYRHRTTFPLIAVAQWRAPTGPQGDLMAYFVAQLCFTHVAYRNIKVGLYSCFLFYFWNYPVILSFIYSKFLRLFLVYL